MKKIESYKIDPDHSICINIEDIYGVVNKIKYKKLDTKYADWD